MSLCICTYVHDKTPSTYIHVIHALSCWNTDRTGVQFSLAGIKIDYVIVHEINDLHEQGHITKYFILAYKCLQKDEEQ